jgi:hypothetical protein
MAQKWPEDIDDPGTVLKKFAAGLPGTIKDAVLVQCIDAFDLFRFDPKLDLFAMYCSIIDDARPHRRAIECAKLIGVMELALEHDEGDAEFYAKIAKETGSTEIEVLGLRAPLRVRHYRSARESFRKIREASLSPRMLFLWNLHLQAEDPIFPLNG